MYLSSDVLKRFGTLRQFSLVAIVVEKPEQETIGELVFTNCGCNSKNHSIITNIGNHYQHRVGKGK